MKKHYIAVLDIGKTNKKILIYDETFTIIEEVKQKFPESAGEGGLRHDPLDEIQTWVFSSLKTLTNQYVIKAVSVSAHGATWTALKEDGTFALPEIAYTSEPGDAFHDDFYEKYGRPENLQKSTATAPFGNFLNIAKGVEYARSNFSDEFKRTSKILFLNAYFGYLLTGNVSAELTYAGCHTYLWNLQKKRWSDLTEAMGIRDLLPAEVHNSWEILGTVQPAVTQKTGLSQDCIVTMGVHDSNGALLPYTVKKGSDFILNSTGTWCVVMHEEREAVFKQEELGKSVFYNINVFGKPVKTAIFMGGLEFEKWLDKIRLVCGDPSFIHSYAPDHIKSVLKEKKLFVLPSVQKGAGQFPRETARVIEAGKTFLFENITAGNGPDSFKDPLKAVSALIISIVIQTKVSIDRCGYKPGLDLYTEGGFRENEPYNKLLASVYPESKCSVTGFKEASAYGAALLGLAALKGVTPDYLADEVDFSETPVEGDPSLVRDFDEYLGAWMRLLEGA